MNLKTILNHPIVGNAYHDSKLMDAIHEYVVCGANPMEGRIAAIKKLDKVMGIEDVQVDAESVEAYCVDFVR